MPKEPDETVVRERKQTSWKLSLPQSRLFMTKVRLTNPVDYELKKINCEFSFENEMFTPISFKRINVKNELV